MTSATECEKLQVEIAADARIAHAVRDNVLDLSISVRTGEETNMDSLSRGDRTGKSPSGKPSGVVTAAM